MSHVKLRRSNRRGTLLWSAAAVLAAACVPDATWVDPEGSGGTGTGGNNGVATGGSAAGASAGPTDLGESGSGGLAPGAGGGTATGGSATTVCEGSACACDAGPCVPNLNAGRPPMRLADISAGNGGGFVITLPAGRGLSQIASGQDTNADGRSDILISSEGGSDDPGQAYLVWGEQRIAPLSLDNFVGQGHGYIIDGPTPQFGRDLALVRDVNLDGRGDLVIAMSANSGPNRDDPLTDYVIFGNQAGTSLSVPSAVQLGRGYPIEGTEEVETDVAGVGDQNADGREDIAIPLLARGSGFVARLLIAFGQSGASPASGFEIVGTDQASAITAVAGAGDVNGDGRPDIFLAGARIPSPAATNAFGYVGWVIFGPATPGTILLTDIEAGRGGFLINEARFNDLTAAPSVAGLGDINGDGLSDLLLGAPGAPANDAAGAGRAYVIFGKRDTSAVNLQTVEAGMENAGGFVINGFDNSDAAGNAVAGIGDQNGDGVRDLVIGANGSEGLDGVGFTGVAYVVYGKSDFKPVELSALQQGADGGFAIFGAAGDDSAGSIVASGDINGDDIDDIVMNGGGKVYVVFGTRPN